MNRLTCYQCRQPIVSTDDDAGVCVNCGGMNRRRNYEENPLRVLLISVALTLFLALCVVWAVRAHGQGLRFEALAGASRFGLHQDGTWYQSTEPFSNDLRGRAYQIGASRLFGVPSDRLRLGWRAAYVDLGRATNTFTAQTDLAFDEKLPTCDPCWAGASNWHAAGISLGPVVEYAITPSISVGAEAGWFQYRAGGQVQYWQTVGDGAGTRGQYVVPWAWHGTPYIGFTARYGYLMASWRVYRDITAQTEGQIGLIGNSASTLLLGASVPY